jgi:phosphoenolpyruvate carboxykinase (ATP)
LAVNTENTGRSPQDRFIVRDSISEDKVWWGKVNILFEPAALKTIHKVTAYLFNKEVYVRDSYVCSDPNYRLNAWLPETPWQTCFATICFKT